MTKKIPAKDLEILRENLDEPEFDNPILSIFGEERFIDFMVDCRLEDDNAKAAAYRIAQDYNWNTELVYELLFKVPGENTIEKILKQLYLELEFHIPHTSSKKKMRQMVAEHKYQQADKVLDKIDQLSPRRKEVLPKRFISYLVLRALSTSFGMRYNFHPLFLMILEDLLGTRNFGNSKVRLVHQERYAALYISENPKASLSQVASEVGVDKTTVLNWKKQKSFIERVERLKNNLAERIDQRRSHDWGHELPEDW